MTGLDANDLMLFARVIEAGSFSRAAERLGLPKSTVSRRIAALEKRLGERLIHRNPRQLAITDFGTRILDYARAVVTEVDGRRIETLEVRRHTADEDGSAAGDSAADAK